MNMVKFLLLSLLIFSGCSSTDPKRKSQIDAALANFPNKTISFDSPVEIEPPPYEVGQWVKFKSVDKKGRPGITTYKIVGEEGGGHWLEIDQEQYSGRSLIKILAIIDRKNLDNCQILKVVQKSGDSDPLELEGPALMMTNLLYKRMLQIMTIQWDDSSREDVTVPAGAFKNAYKLKTKVTFGFISAESTGWYHSNIPINGTVKILVDDGSIMELVDFGMSGAKSAI